MDASASETVRLFRYRSVNEYLWQELELAQWYACPPTKLNDPFDCLVDHLLALDRAKASCKDDVRLEQLNEIKRQFEKQDPRRKQRGIVCFSMVRDSHLMWSHYAAGHTGVCLTYEFPSEAISKAYPSNNEVGGFYQVALASVEYGDDVYCDWLVHGDFDDPIPGQFVVNAAARTMISKATSWSYEQEVRLIMSNEGQISFAHDFLTEVTFGLRTSEVHRRLIKKMLDRASSKTDYLSTMRSPFSDFGLEFKSGL